VFGKPDEHNGVELNFGSTNEASPQNEELGSKDSPDGVLFNCTLNEDWLQGDALTDAVIHIGQHIADLRTPKPGSEAAPAYVLESTASVVTTIVAISSGQKYLTLSGGYLLWDSDWPAEGRDKKMDAVLKDFLSNEAMLSM
jgi:hypothetical protein